MPTRRLQLPVVPLSARRPISVVLIAAIAGALVLNAIIATPTAGPDPIDFSVFKQPGADVLTLRWDQVFQNPIVQAGVLELAFWGIPFLLGVHTLAGWIVFEIVVGSLFSVALSVVIERLLRPLAPAWSIPLALGATAIAALSALLTEATSSGHPAEIVIPLLWVISGVLARRGSPFAAAAVLGSTVGWELWGLLGVPVLLLAPRIVWRTVWRSALGGTLVVALLYVPFALLGPMNTFSFAWTIRDNTMAHLLFPDATAFPWPLRFAQGVLSVGGGVAVILLVRRRPDAIWLAPLVVCVVRLFTDPILAGYYAVPPLFMILIGLTFAIARRQALLFLLCLIMLNVLIDVPLSVVTGGLLVALAIIATVVVVRAGRGETSGRQVVPEIGMSRI